MISAVLSVCYRDLEKPFVLFERTHDLGGTGYATICRLSYEHATLLAKEGISWLFGEPDWGEHFHTIELLRAKQERAELDKKIAMLEEKS